MFAIDTDERPSSSGVARSPRFPFLCQLLTSPAALSWSTRERVSSASCSVARCGRSDGGRVTHVSYVRDVPRAGRGLAPVSWRGRLGVDRPPADCRLPRRTVWPCVDSQHGAEPGSGREDIRGECSRMSAPRTELCCRRQWSTAFGAGTPERRCAFLAELRALLIFAAALRALHQRPRD